MKDLFKEFKPTSWSIDNRTTIFVLTVIITLGGIMAYNNIPKEKFPDIVIPTIFVNTIYPGTSPADIENLVTKHIEKQVKSISGVKKMTSNSIQDFSNVIVEFSTETDIAEAKQKVKDAVDKAKKDLPKDLPADPTIMEIEFSEFPIMFINLSGDFELNQLKKYADAVQDRVEAMKEITRVDIVGALEREIQVNVDMYKIHAAKITLGDIERAIAAENVIISGGNVKMDAMRRSISISGEFKDVKEIENIIINSMPGAPIYLKEIAEIKDTYKEKESYSRLNGKNVITLNVIKRSGENLIHASDKIREAVMEMQKKEFPSALKIDIMQDQSRETRHTLHDLLDTIIIGFILVTLILMFFMGTANAIFVAMSVPLSMFIAFLFLPTIGFTMNMIVLFAFLLGLGIVVDDAIVVIENTHRIFQNGKTDIITAAKTAAGEVFLPVLSGTLTTLAPFFPLAFWTGVIGKFMHFMPITLIITLTASLLVAYIINPVFAVTFMKKKAPPNLPPSANAQDKLGEEKKRPLLSNGLKITTITFIALAAIFYLSGSIGMGNFTLTLLALYLINRFILEKIILKFQTVTWPSFQENYKRFLVWALARPFAMLWSTVALLVLSVMLTTVRSPKVVFFPRADPNFVYVYLTLPVGTSPEYTDSVTTIVEKKVYEVIGDSNRLVESVITNVGIGASEERFDRGVQPHKGKVGVGFVEYGRRNGVSTRTYLDNIRQAVKDIPGVEITVDQEQGGPPVSKPIHIEIKGDKFDDLIATSLSLKHYLDSLHIPGVEELKSDMVVNKPEVIFEINRERANREGISTVQIGMEIRNAVFGKEISRFRDENEDYPILLRYNEKERNDIDAVRNAKITYRDMNMGGAIRQVPVSVFADVKYTNTYGGIKRKDQKRMITLTSNVLSGYNPNEVVAGIARSIKDFIPPPDITVTLTGEQEEQKESASFLGRSLLISLALMLIILVAQFNSFSKPVIIMTEVIFSIIGVLLGLAIFNMDISIVMTGVGIVALGGIVVRNGILLVEFTDRLIRQGYPLKDAIIEAGKIRMTPVLLTATATILGMIPLAIGLNIDFETLFTELNPHLYFGGDSVAFWGPLSWTIIFGLSFATFLTLIIVPVMYLLAVRAKARVKGKLNLAIFLS